MQGILYEESSAWLFIGVTIVLGGWTAWMTGRAVALAWRPAWVVGLASLGLGIAVRFVHFALFEGSFLSLRYYAVDFVIVLAIALLGYRYTRTAQMARQYPWLVERTGPLTWRDKPAPDTVPR